MWFYHSHMKRWSLFLYTPSLGKTMTTLIEYGRSEKVPVLTFHFLTLGSQSLHMIAPRPPYCEKPKSHGEMRLEVKRRKRRETKVEWGARHVRKPFWASSYQWLPQGRLQASTAQQNQANPQNHERYQNTAILSHCIGLGWFVRQQWIVEIELNIKLPI